MGKEKIELIKISDAYKDKLNKYIKDEDKKIKTAYLSRYIIEDANELLEEMRRIGCSVLVGALHSVPWHDIPTTDRFNVEHINFKNKFGLVYRSVVVLRVRDMFDFNQLF